MARSSREDLEFVGLIWNQGGADYQTLFQGKAYLDYFKTFVSSVRRDVGVADLPLAFGTNRIRFFKDVPDDLRRFRPRNRANATNASWRDTTENRTLLRSQSAVRCAASDPQRENGRPQRSTFLARRGPLGCRRPSDGRPGARKRISGTHGRQLKGAQRDPLTALCKIVFILAVPSRRAETAPAGRCFRRVRACCT